MTDARWLSVLVGLMASLAWAAPSSDFQVEYFPSRATALEVSGPPGASVEVREGQAVRARGHLPFSYQPDSAGTFIVALRLRDGSRWEAPVTVRGGAIARLKAHPARAHPEAVIRPSASGEGALSALEFDALRAELRQGHRPKLVSLERAAGGARFTSSQAAELVACFGAAERGRVTKWILPRISTVP